MRQVTLFHLAVLLSAAAVSAQPHRPSLDLLLPVNPHSLVEPDLVEPDVLAHLQLAEALVRPATDDQTQWHRQQAAGNATRANDDLLLAEELRQNWSGAGWEDGSRALYTYDSEGELTERLNQNWTGATWENSFRELHTYTDAGLLSELLWHSWSGSGWENALQYFYTYDDNGILLERLERKWEDDEWETQSRVIYAHNVDGSLS